MKHGFTLVEVLIYVAIFTVSAIFLVGILTVVTRTQVRQASLNEVTSQLSFVTQTITRLVRESSIVENERGVASSTLVLRMASSSLDSVKVYADISTGVLYIESIPDGSSSGSVSALTSSRVRVSDFSATKYENPGGYAVVDISLTLESQGSNPQGNVARTWHGAVARVSAATFDSDVVPYSGFNNLGQSGSLTWQRLYLGDGGVGSPSFTFGNDTNTGVFRVGSDSIGITTGGSERLRLDTNGLTVTGEAQFSGIASDGTGRLVCVKGDQKIGTCSNQPVGGVCNCQ